MSYTTVIYLIGVLGSFHTVLELAVFLLIIASTGVVILQGALRSSPTTETDKLMATNILLWWRKWIVIPLLIVPLILVISPTKSTMHAMLAASIAEEIVDSESVQNIAPKAIKVLDKYLDDALEDE